MNLFAGGRSSGKGSFGRQCRCQHLASAMQARATGQARTGNTSWSVFIFLQSMLHRRTFTVIQKNNALLAPGLHWQAGAAEILPMAKCIDGHCLSLAHQ